MEDKCNKFI